MKHVLLAVGVLAAVAILAWIVIDSDGGDATASTPDVIGSGPRDGVPGSTPPAPAGVGARSIEKLAGGAEGAEAADGGDAGDDVFEGPVVARGRITSELVLPFDELEVVLYDAEGNDLNWAAPASDGTFAMRWDQALRAGWGVASAATEIAGVDGPRPLLPCWCGPHGDHAPGDPPVTCNLTVRPAPVIVGTVLDAETGAPIEGAEITVGSTVAAFVLEESWTDTDDLGRYRLQAELLPPEGALVWCREWEHQAQVQGPFDLADHDVLQIDFHMPPIRVLEGLVVDAGTGRPVPDAPVTLGSPWPGFEEDEDWDFTDDEGRFLLETPDLPLDGAWIHVEGVDGYGAGSVPVTAADSGLLRVALGPLQHLRGLVVDTADLPVVGAEVHVVFHEGFLGIDAGLANGADTDSDGRFVLDLDMAPVESSRLLVISDDHRPYTAALGAVAERSGTENEWVVKVVLEALPGD